MGCRTCGYADTGSTTKVDFNAKAQAVSDAVAPVLAAGRAVNALAQYSSGTLPPTTGSVRSL